MNDTLSKGNLINSNFEQSQCSEQPNRNLSGEKDFSE